MITSIEVDFSKGLDSLPEKEGTYLRQGSRGVEVLTVAYYPPKLEYGIQWGGHYGVSNHRGHDVSQYTGMFVELKINKQED